MSTLVWMIELGEEVGWKKLWAEGKGRSWRGKKRSIERSLKGRGWGSCSCWSMVKAAVGVTGYTRVSTASCTSER
jgi:hypothetical protein